MPTINQLTRKPRTKKVRKSKSPVLLVGKNSIQKKQTVQVSPQKRGVCTRVGTTTRTLRFRSRPEETAPRS